MLMLSFEKRIYIPLPGVEERAGMFKTHLGVNAFHSIQDNQWMQLAELAEKSEKNLSEIKISLRVDFFDSYSGSDIASACREALLRPIRRISAATHFKKVKYRRNSRRKTQHFDV